MGGSLTTSTAQVSNEPTTPKFFRHWQRSKRRSRARAFSQRVACGAACATSETRPRLKHTVQPMRSSSIHQCRHVDDLPYAHMRDCAERGVGGVDSYSCDKDPGFQQTDIDGDELCETLDDCGICSIVRAMETRCVRESDASCQCGKARVLNVFGGESGDKLLALQRRGAFSQACPSHLL